MKIYVQAIMDEDVYDELCSYPEHRVSIIEGSRMETESIIAKEIWSNCQIVRIQKRTYGFTWRRDL